MLPPPTRPPPLSPLGRDPAQDPPQDPDSLLLFLGTQRTRGVRGHAQHAVRPAQNQFARLHRAGLGGAPCPRGHSSPATPTGLWSLGPGRTCPAVPGAAVCSPRAGAGARSQGQSYGTRGQTA